MCCENTWQLRKTLRMLMATMSSNSSGVISYVGVRFAYPALLTTMSTFPHAWTIRSRAASKAPLLRTSSVIAIAVSPAGSIVLATASAVSAFTSLTATFAPEAWNSRAITSPTPRPAPVTSATCPSKRNAQGRYCSEVMFVLGLRSVDRDVRLADHGAPLLHLALDEGLELPRRAAARLHHLVFQQLADVRLRDCS